MKTFFNKARQNIEYIYTEILSVKKSTGVNIIHENFPFYAIIFNTQLKCLTDYYYHKMKNTWAF